MGEHFDAPAVLAGPEPDCPMWRLASFILRASAVVDAMDDDEADTAFAETMAPAWADLFHRTPETRSPAGAAAALRALMLSDGIDEAEARVLGSVVTFLERPRESLTPHRTEREHTGGQARTRADDD